MGNGGHVTALKNSGCLRAWLEYVHDREHRSGKNMRLVIACILAASTLSGCGSSKRTAVEDAVREQLVDPASAQFGEMKDFDAYGTSRVCIEVNAKNRMGGYSGPQTAILDAEENGSFTFVRFVSLASCD